MSWRNIKIHHMVNFKQTSDLRATMTPYRPDTEQHQGLDRFHVCTVRTCWITRTKSDFLIINTLHSSAQSTLKEDEEFLMMMMMMKMDSNKS